jgi:hypothetical protein
MRYLAWVRRGTARPDRLAAEHLVRAMNERTHPRHAAEGPHLGGVLRDRLSPKWVYYTSNDAVLRVAR